MALGAALATGKPQAYAVVPGPGLLNSSAALLTAYSMNAQVLALVGQIPDRDIGRKLGHLHEINDQAGILARLVDHAALVPDAAAAPRMVAEAFRAMASGRPGPAALECAINVWGKPGDVTPVAPLPADEPAIDEDALRDAAKRLGDAKNPLIVVGGGAQDASPEVTALAGMLQAPVLCGFRRGQGVLDARNPLAVTLPLGHELWGEADVVLAVGTRLFFEHTMWGVDDDLAIIAVNADADEPSKHRKPAVALIGDAAPILRRLIDALPRTTRSAHRAPMRCANATRAGPASSPRSSRSSRSSTPIRAELPEDGILVDEVTQIGFAARLAFPVYRPRTFLSPGYQDNLGWGYATALGAQDARRDVPVVSINGDGGFMYTANELVHRGAPPHSAGGDRVRRRLVRQCAAHPGRELRQPADRERPRQSGLREVRRSVRRGGRARAQPEELRGALRRGFARRDGPTLIEMPVGPMPSPWEFIFRPKVRG